MLFLTPLDRNGSEQTMHQHSQLKIQELLQSNRCPEYVNGKTQRELYAAQTVTHKYLCLMECVEDIKYASVLASLGFCDTQSLQRCVINNHLLIWRESEYQ